VKDGLRQRETRPDIHVLHSISYRDCCHNKAGIIINSNKIKKKKRRQTAMPDRSPQEKGGKSYISNELPHAFRPVSRPVSRDRCAVLLHNSHHLDAIFAFLFRPGRRPRSDLGPYHVLGIDHCAVKDFHGLGVAVAVVRGAAEEVHANAVALLHHRLPLLARCDHVAARLVVASDSHDAAVGARAPAGRGENARENPREAGFEGREAGADDADLDFQVAPEGCHGIVPAYVF
jgi:hypothetical protein